MRQYASRRSEEFLQSVKTIIQDFQEQGLDLNELDPAVTKYPEYIRMPDQVVRQFVPGPDGQLGLPYTCQDFISINLRLPSSSDSVKTIGIATMFPVFHPVDLKILLYPLLYRKPQFTIALNFNS